MSESQRISALRDRLSQIESQQVNEYGGALARVGGALARRPNTAVVPRPTTVPPGGPRTIDMGKAVEVPRTALPAPAKPVAPTAPSKPRMGAGTKAGLGVGVAGGLAAGTAMFGGDKEQGSGTPSGQNQSDAETARLNRQGTKPTPGKPAVPTQASQPAPVSTPLTPDEEQELALLANELEKEMGRLPALDDLLALHKKLRPGETFPQM